MGLKTLKTVYVETAHVSFIEHEFGMKYTEWVRKQTEDAFFKGSQKTIPKELYHDMTCKDCGITWIWKDKGIMCPDCNKIGRQVG